MKLYELKVEEDGVDEVFAISLVESPAIESDFIYFDKEEIMFAWLINVFLIVSAVYAVAIAVIIAPTTIPAISPPLSFDILYI